MNKQLLRKYLTAGAVLAGLAVAAPLAGHSQGQAPSSMVAAPWTDHGVVTSSDPDGWGPLPGNVPRVEGQLVVDLKDGLTSADLQSLNQKYGLDLKYNSAYSYESALTVGEVGERRMPELLTQLAADPNVESVSPNYIYESYAMPPVPAGEDFPNDPMKKFQWHMDQIRVQKAWPWSTGQHVTVAVIDTGVAYLDWKEFKQAEDFDKAGWTGGYDFVNKRAEACDDHCHGTHVAGTVAESTNNGKGVMGVAFDAKVMPIKVLSKFGSGTLADIADGIRFSADHGATVINMSLGGPFGDSTMGAACRYAYSKGVTIVCAAGNSNRNKPGYPAGYPECVCVSATDFNEELTFYSNHGPQMSIAAPGGDTRADKNGDGKVDGVLQNTIQERRPDVNGYYLFQGTSMASPHVAGVAALINGLGVTNPKAVESVLYGTARSKGKEGREKGFGAGICDAERATWRAGFVYGAIRLGLGAVLLALPLLAMLRRGWLLGPILALPGLVIGASGLFFLPLAHPQNTAYHTLLTQGFPSWDMALLGAGGHGNPLFFSCLLPILLSILVVESNALRAIVAGFSAGVAAHLLFAAVMGTVSVQFMPIALIGRLWLAGNGLICVFLSVVLGEDQP